MQAATPTRIADLKVGDLVQAHGGVFRITQPPFDSITHSEWKDADGWSVGPAGVAVAHAECIEGVVLGYFQPGYEWKFQGATWVHVNVIH
jgi:hypothetical protein